MSACRVVEEQGLFLPLHPEAAAEMSLAVGLGAHAQSAQLLNLAESGPGLHLPADLFQHPALDGGWAGEKTFQIEYQGLDQFCCVIIIALLSADLFFIGSPCKLFKELFFVIEDGRGLNQGLVDSRIVILPQSGEEVKTDPVPQQGMVKVGAVLAPGDLLLLEILNQVFLTFIQERPDDPSLPVTHP